MRRIFEDKAVDAVVIASCDHWHAPAAILAANTGKHVYVEKPCSHNVREGRLMVEAARKNNVVIQHGTQSRSNPGRRQAVQMLREGMIGDVLVAKHVNSQRRANIGRQTASEPPDYLDYDLWVGPAEWMPYQSNFVHYHWHWFYNFGTGDIGNDGVHGIDVARWGLGVTTHPSFVTGYGSKLFFDDDQQFPDTYTITYEYPGDGKIGDKRLLIYEQRIWSPYRQDAEGNSIFFYGTTGMMTIGRGGTRVFGQNNQLIRHEEPVSGGDAHQRDFLDAIQDRSRRPNADIEVGHLSSSLCHLGNIVSRAAGSIRFDPQTEQVLGDKEANQLLVREYREGHWAVPPGI
jgi:predicted dehydrogenase